MHGVQSVGAHPALSLLRGGSPQQRHCFNRKLANRDPGQVPGSDGWCGRDVQEAADEQIPAFMARALFVPRYAPVKNTSRPRRPLGPSRLRKLTLVTSLSAACAATPVSAPPAPPPLPPHWSAVPPLPLDERIRTNQLGFQPAQPKHVVIAWPAAAPLPTAELVFHIVPLDTPWQPVLAGSLADLGVDADSGEHVLRGDFSALQTPGHYRVVLPRRGYSAPFRIHPEVYRDVLRLATRFFYLQRSGAAKDDPLTGLRHGADYAAPAPLRAVLDARSRVSPTAQRSDVSGGWWDAGDFGRYVPPAASTLMLLLYAYRFNPGAFADGALAIPESGNGVPDLLDELRWELSWLLKMQRPDGAVHHKVATRSYPDVMADRDPQPALLYEISTQATASFAGALSEASIVYRRVDPLFSASLGQAAQRAWRFLAAHPNKLPAHGFRNPDDPNGGDYSIKDGDENELRLWAAAGLLHATGERVYAEEVARRWPHQTAMRHCGLGWPCGSTFAMMAYLDSASADVTLQEQMRRELTAQAAAILQVIGGTAYQVALKGTKPPLGYDWGSVGQVLDAATLLLLANLQHPDPQLLAGAAAQLSWVLGHNPLSKTFITGAGHNPVRAPHHRPSNFLGAPIPGAVGEGPNAMSIGGDPVLQQLFTRQLPPALRYADDAGSWATNEPTIYYNAAFVAVAAWFTPKE